MSDLYRDFIDQKADSIINSLGGTITPAPTNTELYRDFLGRKFDDVINSIDNILPIGTASGNPVTFYTSLSKELVKCNIAVNAWQEGSGDPSPSNVRPIHGFSEVNVNANAVIHTIQLGQEVYGAEVDVVNGVLSVNMYSFVMDGDANKYASPANWYSVDVADSNPTFGAYWYFNGRGFDNFPKPKNVSSADRKMLCETFQKINGVYKQTTPYSMGIAGNGNAQYFGVRIPAADLSDTSSSSALTNSIMEWFQNNPTTFYYEIETPITVQLTPTQIETLIGNNTIFADTGDVDVAYRHLPIDII